MVVVVLASAAVAATIAQRHRGIDRLDDDLERTMATLVGVMRHEFGEGLNLADATAEASQEVVAPGRSLAITTVDGQALASWGLPVPALASTSRGPASDRQTVGTGDGPDARVLRRTIDDGPGRRFTALVMAPLSELEYQQTEMTRAMSIGVACALVIAGAGGWLIGRKTLAPLATMAQQAQQVDARDPRGRMTVPHADDEIGQLAAAFNGLLDRLSTSLDQQRQFMADASHELRTPVSVIRTTAQVTLSQGDRAPDEYRESLDDRRRADRAPGPAGERHVPALARRSPRGVPAGRVRRTRRDRRRERARLARPGAAAWRHRARWAGPRKSDSPGTRPCCTGW